MARTEGPTTATAGQRRHWRFEVVADGLDVTPSAMEVAKRVGNNALFDADGAPLSAEAAEKASTWRSHHSFSGRCSLRQEASEANNIHTTTAATAVDYDDWSVGFHLRSATADPHMLVSVAPRYFPYAGASSFMPPADNSSKQETVNGSDGSNGSSSGEVVGAAKVPFLSAPSAEEQGIYIRRMLETPLIYEEPYAISVECNARGLFVWSDQWAIHGKRIATTCIVPSGRGGGGGDDNINTDIKTEGFVKLSWWMPRHTAASEAAHQQQTPVASVAVSLGGYSSEGTLDTSANTNGSSPSSSSASGSVVQWQQVFETTLELEDALAGTAAFVPYVTMIEAGESVRIIIQ